MGGCLILGKILTLVNQMDYTERHIVETYSGLFSGLSSISKLELIENLSKSIKNEKKDKDKIFFKSFGSFGSSKSAEDIVADIKAERKFNTKDLNF